MINEIFTIKVTYIKIGICIATNICGLFNNLTKPVKNYKKESLNGSKWIPFYIIIIISSKSRVSVSFNQFSSIT